MTKCPKRKERNQMKFLVNGKLNGEVVTLEIEGEDREDAKDELFHSIPMIDGKFIGEFPKVDLRTLRRAPEEVYNLIAHLERQREFSMRAFGPGTRAKGVVDHIRKELVEIENHPTDLDEWIDVAMLAFDGAWRAGFEPTEIVAAFKAKLAKNERREWPDWRTADPEKAIEHVRS
jgi:hypothetical protein